MIGVGIAQAFRRREQGLAQAGGERAGAGVRQFGEAGVEDGQGFVEQFEFRFPSGCHD